MHVHPAHTSTSTDGPGPVSRVGGVPVCVAHPGSVVRRFRCNGPRGPGVYPQCVPANGEERHLLDWADAPLLARSGHNENVSSISVAELDILVDAAEGLTTNESAARRHKGRETVKTQRKNILVKLGARNMTQAVAIAFDSDVIVARMAA
jgi:DNA-binding CsgD family transcriptional regulator